jgi:hypothetical protein
MSGARLLQPITAPISRAAPMGAHTPDLATAALTRHVAVRIGIRAR